jgi:hypothetical protein
MKWKEDDSVQEGNNPVIRQAISCDICGAEMQHTNHWFVAYDQGAELRVSGWSAGKRLRAGAKHLCGQTCLHKLVDEFMARTVSTRTQATAVESSAAEQKAQPPRASRIGANLDASLDASLTPSAARISPHAAPERQGVQSVATSLTYVDEFESSARLIAPNDAVADEQQARETEAPAYAARNWHAEAWKRERERTLRGDTRATAITAHRRNIA